MKKRELAKTIERLNESMNVLELIPLINESLIDRILNRFKIKNLPKELTSDIILQQLLFDGHCGFFKKDNKYYCLHGNFQNIGVYSNLSQIYCPKYMINNPILGSMLFDIENDEIVILKNNSFAIPDINLIDMYSILIADNINSLDIALVNTRAMNIFSADSDTQKKSIDTLQRNLRLGVYNKVVEKEIIDDTESIMANSRSNNITPVEDILQSLTNIYRQFYREFGFLIPKDKSQAVLSDESENDNKLTEFILSSFIERIQEQLDKVNTMFGLNLIIEVNEKLMGEKADEEIEEEIIYDEDFDKKSNLVEETNERMEETREDLNEEREDEENESNNNDESKESEESTEDSEDTREEESREDENNTEEESEESKEDDDSSENELLEIEEDIEEIKEDIEDIKEEILEESEDEEDEVKDIN